MSALAHVQQFGVVYIAGVVAAVVSILGTGYTGFQTWDSLATDLEVANVMDQHESRMRVEVEQWESDRKDEVASLETAIGELSSEIGKMLRKQDMVKMDSELATLYTYRCRTGSSDFDELIDTRRNDYLIAFGEPYTVRDCDFYLSR